MAYQNKNVLVTGGAGFIGSHIVEALVYQGAHVTVLDNLSTGTIENLNTIKNSIHFIEGSITDYSTCQRAVASQDIIFHLAAFISVPDSFNDPLSCHTTNITGTSLLLEAARQASIKRCIFSSTSAVYGPHQGLCSETTPLNPQSPYGFSKVIGEQLCQYYYTMHGLECIILRYFNVFGPRQNPHGPYAGAMAQFRHRMAHNQPITIYGDGLQTRDFVPVHEVARANLLAGSIAPLAPDQNIMNVASGTSISLLTLYQQLKNEFPDYGIDPEFMPARSGDIQHSTADIGRLKKLLSLSL